MYEFELIKNYFQKLSKKSTSALDLNDDVLNLIYENYKPSRTQNILENTQVEQLITTCAQPCYVLDNLDDLLFEINQQAKSSDTIVVMSNGSFGNIHQKLLNTLAS